MGKMMLKKILIILIFILTNVVGSNASVLAQNLRYSMCPSLIDTIDIVKSELKKTYSLLVKLNSMEATRFSKVTKENIGKELAIIIGDKEIIKAVISSQIDSGIITLSGYTKLQAKQLKIDIKNNSIKKKCGFLIN